MSSRCAGNCARSDNFERTVRVRLFYTESCTMLLDQCCFVDVIVTINQHTVSSFYHA